MWVEERLMSAVNHLDYDNNGQKLYFDRVYYRRGSGNNTDVNEVGVDAVNEYDCCVRCQEAVCLLPMPFSFLFLSFSTLSFLSSLLPSQNINPQNQTNILLLPP